MGAPGKASATVTIRISGELYQEIATLARKRDCTLGEALELLIIEKIQAVQEEKQAVEEKLNEVLQRVERLESLV